MAVSMVDRPFAVKNSVCTYATLWCEMEADFDANSIHRSSVTPSGVAIKDK